MSEVENKLNQVAELLIAAGKTLRSIGPSLTETDDRAHAGMERSASNYIALKQIKNILEDL